MRDPARIQMILAGVPVRDVEQYLLRNPRVAQTLEAATARFNEAICAFKVSCGGSRE